MESHLLFFLLELERVIPPRNGHHYVHAFAAPTPRLALSIQTQQGGEMVFFLEAGDLRNPVVLIERITTALNRVSNNFTFIRGKP